jgi:hypothetical protein
LAAPDRGVVLPREEREVEEEERREEAVARLLFM